MNLYQAYFIPNSLDPTGLLDSECPPGGIARSGTARFLLQKSKKDGSFNAADTNTRRQTISSFIQEAEAEGDKVCSEKSCKIRCVVEEKDKSTTYYMTPTACVINTQKITIHERETPQGEQVTAEGTFDLVAIILYVEVDYKCKCGKDKDIVGQQ